MQRIPSQETKKEAQETTSRNSPNYGLRRLVALALIGAGAASGMYAVNKHNDRSDRPVKPEAVKVGHVDRSITSISLEDGARIRKDPFVPSISSESNNLVDELEEPITVETDGKAVVASETPDGNWYGIPAESLRRIDPDFKLKGDSDGYVWVNHQKATPKIVDVADDINP
jgi:hypothetical protein